MPFHVLTGGPPAIEQFTCVSFSSFGNAYQPTLSDPTHYAVIGVESGSNTLTLNNGCGLP